MSTKVVNLHREEYDVYIGRAGRGEDGYFGNPYRLGRVQDRDDPAHLAEILARYREYFLRRVQVDAEFRRRVLALRGKRLGCFCAPGPCHGDVIAEWVDAQPVEQIEPAKTGLLALTLHRPWPWAICRAGKPIENRGWEPPPAIIGKHIAVHAGLTWDHEGARWIESTFGIEVPEESLHPTGIVAVVRVAGVRSESRGDPWWVGPRAWEFADVVELERPVLCRGAQKLWRVPEHLLPDLRRAYAAARARRVS